MKIVPSLEIKEAQMCVAGELVRFAWQSQSLAFYAQNKAGVVFAVTLLDDTGTFRPRYLGAGQPYDHVLSYGSDFVIEADPSSLADMASSQYSDVSGCLILTVDGWIMPVTPVRGLQHAGRVHYHFETGTFGDSPGHNIATFTKWKVFVAGSDPQRLIEIGSFDISGSPKN
jgi:hypothetical protein